MLVFRHICFCFLYPVHNSGLLNCISTVINGDLIPLGEHAQWVQQDLRPRHVCYQCGSCHRLWTAWPVSPSLPAHSEQCFSGEAHSQKRIFWWRLLHSQISVCHTSFSQIVKWVLLSVDRTIWNLYWGKTVWENTQTEHKHQQCWRSPKHT